MKKSHILPNAYRLYVKPDAGFYIGILASFIVGGIFAAAFALTLPELTCKELLLYLDDFFQNISRQGADSAVLFKTGLLLHAKNFGFLFLFSVMVVGAPFIAGFAAVKGFMHCFTLFFLFRMYGIRAAAFTAAGMLPHYLLLMPCYLIVCAVCLKFSVQLFCERYDMRKKLPRFILALAGLLCLAVMSSLLQAYVEPVLIRLIAGLYITPA